MVLDVGGSSPLTHPSPPSRSLWISLALALAAALLCLLVRAAGGFEGVELQLYDLLRRVQAGEGREDPRIVLVGISDVDMDRFGYPIPDAILARALERLLEAEPRAIGVDLYRTIPVPPGQADLRRVATGNSDRVVLARFGVADSGRVQLLDWLDREAATGFVDQRADPGGEVRRSILYLWEDGRVGGSFALELALRWLLVDGVEQGPHPHHPGGLQLGDALLEPLPANAGGYRNADTGGFQILMDYANGLAGFERLSLGELLTEDRPSGFGRDAIVILGTTAETVKDHFYTPLSRGIDRTTQTLYGVELHAHQTSQLLRLASGEARATRPIPEGVEMALVVVACLLGGGLGALRSSAWFAGTAGVAAAIGAVVLAYLALLAGRWIPIVPAEAGFALSLAAVLLYSSYSERQERELVMQLFGKFTGSAIAEDLWKRRNEFMDGGRVTPRELAASVLMADLEGFTTAAEALAPAELLGWINTFMGEMTRLVEAHGGFVDDFAGDGVKANFGVPIPRASESDVRRDARNAVACALAMGRSMDALNESFRARGWPTARLRVGIQTGAVVVGAIGGATSMRYTTIGDVVNTAARLEAHDKESFEPDALFRIHVGADTMELLGEEVEARSLGSHRLRGKQQELEIFRVLAAGPELTDRATDPASHQETAS